MDQGTFERIKKNHSGYASWAVWADGNIKSKANVGDLGIFETKDNHALLEKLNPDFVLVGLNISRRVQFPLANFHDGRPSSMDYKIRYALRDTKLWGAYMTDIIKDFEQKASGKMMAYLRQNKSFERENLEKFKRELSDLGANRPTLVAFGGDAFEILTRNLEGHYDIWKVPHYSNYTSKENYRKGIADIIESKAGPSGLPVGHG